MAKFYKSMSFKENYKKKGDLSGNSSNKEEISTESYVIAELLEKIENKLEALRLNG